MSPRSAFLFALCLACSAKQAAHGAIDAGPVVPAELQGITPDACAGAAAFEADHYDRTYALPAATAFTRRAFPLLAILSSTAFSSDSVLGPLAADQRGALDDAKACADATCVRAKLVAFDSESVVQALADRFGNDAAFTDALRKSGAFMRWQDADGATLVRESWTFTAEKLPWRVRLVCGRTARS